MQIGIEIGFISGESARSASNVPLPLESIADLAQPWPCTRLHSVAPATVADLATEAVVATVAALAVL